MRHWPQGMIFARVALLAEGVGRNWTSCETKSTSRVALLAEGVGRNFCPHVHMEKGLVVALLAEGVGRNPRKCPGLSAGRCRPPRGGRG